MLIWLRSSGTITTHDPGGRIFSISCIFPSTIFCHLSMFALTTHDELFKWLFVSVFQTELNQRRMWPWWVTAQMFVESELNFIHFVFLILTISPWFLTQATHSKHFSDVVHIKSDTMEADEYSGCAQSCSLLRSCWIVIWRSGAFLWGNLYCVCPCACLLALMLAMGGR